MRGVCGGYVLLGLSAEVAARSVDSADLTEKNLRFWKLEFDKQASAAAAQGCCGPAQEGFGLAAT
ncbi:MAG: hypothetical protein RLZZ458_3197 [Planctomycetota bacterium]